MARAQLDRREASSISVCGKMLRKGQTITVPATAVGVREEKMVSRGKIRVIKSNKPGQVQIKAL